MELHGCVAKWDGSPIDLVGIHARRLRRSGENCRGTGTSHGQCSGHGHYMGVDLKQASAWQIHGDCRDSGKDDGSTPEALPHKGETYLCVAIDLLPHDTQGRCEEDGTLTALELTVRDSGGAYPAGGPGRAFSWVVRDLYTVRTFAQA